MARKKKQRGKIRRERKQKRAGLKGGKSPKQILSQSLVNNNPSSLAEEMRKAWEKDQQELDRRIELKRKQKEQDTETERVFREKRAEQDMVDKERAERVQLGDILYSEVEALINAYPTPGSEYLTNLLKSEIGRYGKKAVLYSLASAPDFIVELARTICYYEDNGEAVHRALENFSHAIRGALPSEEEARELGAVMDSMTHLTKEHED